MLLWKDLAAKDRATKQKKKEMHSLGSEVVRKFDLNGVSKERNKFLV